LSAVDLINAWNQVKDEIAPWNREICSQVGTQVLMDLLAAYGKFFESRKTGRKVGFPSFKTRGRCVERFRIPGDTIRYGKDDTPVITKLYIGADGIKIPRIGLVAIKNDPSARLLNTRVTSVTVSNHADRWYGSCAIVREIAEPAHVAAKGAVVGIDVGIKTFAVTSDGQEIVAPKPLQAALTDLRKLGRAIARQRNVRDGVKTKRTKKREAHAAHQAGIRYWPTKAEKKAKKAEGKVRRETAKTEKDTQLKELQAQARVASTAVPTHLPRLIERKSKRLIEREKQLARKHQTVANRRADFLHETTTHLVRKAVKTHGTYAIEDLKVRNLVKNHRLARRIMDLGWGEFRRQLSYKILWAGTGLYIAPTFFASSKTCSRCGEIKPDLTLADRTYRCDHCGLLIDRDLNAARNLRKQAVMAIARGESVRPRMPGQDSLSRKLTPTKKRSPKIAA
jgi:IS605 OrfB family transposase